MTHDLTVEAGDTYRVDSGVRETHARADIDGTLNVQGRLVLNGEEARAVQPPTGIDLPVSINFLNMNMGIAVFLIGILATTLTAGHIMRNHAALVLWGLAVIFLLIGGVFGMGLEVFWMSMVAVIVLLIAGFVMRLMAP